MKILPDDLGKLEERFRLERLRCEQERDSRLLCVEALAVPDQHVGEVVRAHPLGLAHDAPPGKHAGENQTSSSSRSGPRCPVN